MDRYLFGWARQVKARARQSDPDPLPPVWLFLIPDRLPDVSKTIRGLPSGLAGVVLHAPHQLAAGQRRQIASLCRRKHLLLASTGHPLGMAAPCGLHIRRGRRTVLGRPAFITSSAHNAEECRRARLMRADIIFLSPVFATRSHPGVSPLGARRWWAIARPQYRRLGALGGITHHTLRQLPRRCHFIGAIDALLPPASVSVSWPTPRPEARTGRSRYAAGDRDP